MEVTVLNLEPFEYSKKAIEKLKPFFQYKESSWDNVRSPDFSSNADVIIIRLGEKLTKDIISKFPSLKVVVSATTGLDHIDLQTCKAHSIKVLNLRPYQEFLDSIPSTAEMAFALMLSLIRNIPAAVIDVAKGNWDRDKFRGYQLKGKTLGIVGLGRTGSKMANYAEAFGLKVVYFDPHVHINKHNKVSTIEELFKCSDIVSLHVHLKEDTFMLVNESTLKTADNFFLINTSRGDVIDEEAVLNSLKNGSLKGFATDVLSGELSGIRGNKLFEALTNGYNIIITPHLGGATFDAMHSCEEFIAERLIEIYSKEH
jgi:D-3-phosphoglycerate dehydrogenase / 2-oxoglutarate reductase